MSWNPDLHPRDGDTGRFTENWAARLSEQISAARREGRFGGYTPARIGNRLPPEARRKGFVRVGDHPTRQGAVGGADPGYFTPSTHPDAGGVWVDPARPGTSRAPAFRNDFGSLITDLTPPKTRSQERKEQVRSRRREDWTHTPDDRERVPASEGGKIGRRLEGAPEAAVKQLRRAQRRARIEGSARQPVRRTPRGTQVDGWMSKVSDSIGQKGSGRGQDHADLARDAAPARRAWPVCPARW